MKNISIILLLLNSFICFSQNEFNLNTSYDKDSQMLLIRIKNQTNNMLGLDKGMETPKVFDGSVFYISDSPKTQFSKEEMFALMEYDEGETKFKHSLFRRIIWISPYEEKCFAISLRGKDYFNESNIAYIKCRLKIIIPPKEKGGKPDFKTIDTDVYEISLK